jgi:hypothetical protein
MAEALKKCDKKSTGRLKALKEKRFLLFARPENVKKRLCRGILTFPSV